MADPMMKMITEASTSPAGLRARHAAPSKVETRGMCRTAHTPPALLVRNNNTAMLSPPAVPDPTCSTVVTRDGVSARNSPVMDHPAAMAGTEARNSGRAFLGTRTRGHSDASPPARLGCVSGVARTTTARLTNASVKRGNTYASGRVVA